MRICFLGDASWVPLQSLIEYVLDNGHDVHAIGSGDFPKTVIHHLLPEGHISRILARRTVRRIVKRIRPSITHAFYLTSYGYLASGIRDSPVLATSMGTDVFGAPELSRFLRPLRNHFAKCAIRRADRIHSVAEHMTERLVELGADPDIIHTFPRGILVDRFPEVGRTDLETEVPEIVCTRKLEPVYDHRTILKAARILKDQGAAFRMRFIGKGYLRDELIRTADSLGVRKEIEFRDQVPHSEIPELLAGADIYLSASLSDGTSSSLLEAMASGCVPVVSAIPGNRPWMTETRAQLMFTPGDPEALAEALTVALREKASWPAWRAECRSFVLEHGSRADSLARILKIYRELA